MNTQINFPNIRIQKEGITNPRFVSDIVNANESLLTALQTIFDLANDEFAIISGCEYLGQSGFSEGFVFMSGKFYAAPAIAADKYLAPNPTDTLMKLHGDGNSYNTYRIFNAIQSNTAVEGGSPQMSGNMDAFRKGNKYVLDIVTALDSQMNTIVVKNPGLDPVSDYVNNGATQNVYSDYSAVYINVTGSGGGVINYELNSGNKSFRFQYYSQTSSSMTINLKHNGKTIKSVTAAQSHGGEFFFINSDGTNWIQINDYTKI